MTLTLPKTCSMGSSQTGLVGTIGVTILYPDGTVHTARSITNIYEIGGGAYGKEIDFDDNWIGSIKWDTGGGTPFYAVEEYIYYENNPKVDGIQNDLDNATDGLGALKDLIDALPNPSGIADAVWDEKLDEHTTIGTAGKILQQIKSIVGAILGLIS